MKNKVIRIILFLIMLLLSTTAYGCSQVSDWTQGSSTKSPNIVREAELGDKWRMYQLLVNVEADNRSLILLKLDYGDKVDGYFFIEKGNDIRFEITGKSLIYKASATNEDSPKVTSGRFSFRASPEQGNTYTLTFSNPPGAEQSKATVFLEVVYPAGGSLFMPIEKK